MRNGWLIVALVIVLGWSPSGRADDVATVKKAVQKSTLAQPGTKPFHLKATLAPSRERDRDSGRTGEVEIWWASPTQWKREVRSPDFYQIAIVNGGQEWQKNDGDYFPEWLREVAIELIDPVPSLDQVLAQVRSGEMKKIMGMTHFSWMMMSTDGNVQKAMGGALAINDQTGLLLYGGGFGWGGGFKDYKKFHGRMVAQTVNSGSPEVTARVTTLEDLGGSPAGIFESKGSGDSPLLRTVMVDEPSLRKNLLTMEPIAWPPLQNGPLEGLLTTEIVVDRTGRVRQVGSIVGDNAGVDEVAKNAIVAMRFKPYLENGVAVQVVSRITMPFKTVRPVTAH
jgi:hypothetical protein